MDVDEVPVARMARDPQDVRHGALTRDQDRADQQKPGMAPGAVDEQRCERQDDPDEAGGPGGAWRCLLQETAPAYASRPLRHISPPDRPPEWPKSSLREANNRRTRILAKATADWVGSDGSAILAAIPRLTPFCRLGRFSPSPAPPRDSPFCQPILDEGVADPPDRLRSCAFWKISSDGDLTGRREGVRQGGQDPLSLRR